MANSEITVDSSQATRKLANALKRIMEESAPLLNRVGQALAIDAALRAPSPEEEYRVMMLGGDEQFPLVGGPGGLSDGDGRLRFYKSAEFYLQNFIPTNFVVTGFSNTAFLGVGSRQQLNEATAYSYRNINQDIHDVTFPFLEAWEHGGTFEIKPKDVGKNGKPYPLSPAPGSHVAEMVKTIPAKEMYHLVDTERITLQTIGPAIRELVRSLN